MLVRIDYEGLSDIALVHEYMSLSSAMHFLKREAAHATQRGDMEYLFDCMAELHENARDVRVVYNLLRSRGAMIINVG